MKFLTVLVILVITSVQAKTLVISDIDDTLKRTAVLRYFTGGLRTTNPFIGLPKLFNDYLCNEESSKAKREYCLKFRGHDHSEVRSLIYVTAATDRLQMFGREFISRSNFPQVAVIGKEVGSETLEFKIRVLKEIIKGGAYDEIILIGDNGEHDVGAYKAITNHFFDKKISTFIHQVYNPSDKSGEKKGVGLATGQVPYFTASDLSIEFFARGLISESQLKLISSEVYKYLSSDDSDLYEQVIPSWSSCRPFITNYKRPSVDLSVETKKILDSIEKRMARLCR